MSDDQALGLRRLFTRHPACLLGVVGEDSAPVTLDLAIALFESGRRVLVLDRSHGTLAQMLGVGARYDLRHALQGEKALDQVALAGPGTVVVVPAARAMEGLDQAPLAHWSALCAELDAALGPFDVILVNGTPPASPDANVLLVLAPTSTSLTHAYTALKTLSRRGVPRRCEIVIHGARSEAAALDAFDSVALTAGRFLGMTLALAGTLPGSAKPANRVESRRRTAMARIAERLMQAPVARKAVNH